MVTSTIEHGYSLNSSVLKNSSSSIVFLSFSTWSSMIYNLAFFKGTEIVSDYKYGSALS